MRKLLFALVLISLNSLAVEYKVRPYLILGDPRTLLFNLCSAIFYPWKDESRKT